MEKRTSVRKRNDASQSLDLPPRKWMKTGSSNQQQQGNFAVRLETSQFEPSGTLSNRAILSHEQQYQHCDHDETSEEGMWVFLKPPALELQCAESTRYAASLLCQGQRHIHRNSLKDATICLQEALDIARKDSDKENTQLLIMRIQQNLGYCHYRQGSLADALLWYKRARQTVPLARAGVSQEAAINNSIAILLSLQDKSNFEIALALLNESLVIYQNSDKAGSIETATVMNSIGRVHFINGSFQQALFFFQKAIALRRRLLGSDSLDVAVTILNQGQTHQRLGQHDEALKSYNEFLSIVGDQKSARLSHYLAVTYKCIAEVHHEQGRLELALHMFERALELGRVALGGAHPVLAATLNKLATLCFQKGDVEMTLRNLLHGLAMERICLEPDSPHIITTLMNIAHVHRTQGEFAAAFQRYHEVYVLQVKKHGPDSLEVADVLSTMALMNYHMHLYTSSINLHKKALHMRLQHYGTSDHYDIVSSLNSIGLAQFSQKNFKEAKESTFLALQIQRRLFGKDHQEVAILWYNIATIHLEAGEDDFAITAYKEVLRIEITKKRGYKDDGLVLTLQHIGWVYQRRGEIEEALEYFKAALEVEKSRERTNPTAIAMLLNLVGNFHLQGNSIGQMMDCYIEAARLVRDELQNESSLLVIAGHNFCSMRRLHPPCAAAA